MLSKSSSFSSINGKDEIEAVFSHAALFSEWADST